MKKLWILLIIVALAAAVVFASGILDPQEPEHVHSLVKVDGIAATCTENGTEEYYTCSCEKLFADAEGTLEITEPKAVEKLGHAFTDYKSNGDATCTADGTETAKCDRCEVTDTKSDDGSKKEHTFDQENTELEGALKSAATCDDAAVYYKSCTCGAISESETFISGSSLGHSYGEWENAGDVGHKQSCSCGDTKTEPHAWDNGVVTTDPTHTENGTRTYTCTVCSATRTEVVDMITEHSYNQEKAEEKYLKSAPTCTNAAVYYKSCICGEFSNADDALTFEFGEADGHTEKTVSGYAATCTSTGLTDGVICSVCDAIITAQVEIPVADHSEEVVAGYAASCTEPGITDGKKCSVCGSITLEQSAIDPLGHTYDNDKDVDCNVCSETRIVKLTTPDNTDSKLFYLSSSGYIEIDRAADEAGARVSMFETGVDHVVFYVYESADAAKEDYVARFALKGTPVSVGVVDFFSIDGSIVANVVKGQNGNFYVDKGEQTGFYNFLKALIGYDYSYGQTYYFAAQAIAAEGTSYESSDISEIGANGFARDASKGNERYTVSVLDGLIDGSFETVTAGYGVELTLTATVEDGKVFKGWYLIDAEGNEIGEALSAELTHTVIVTDNSSYKALFVVEKTKLTAPDNSASKLLYYASSSYIEIDRANNSDGARVSMFGTGVDHVIFYVYESADAAKEDYVARFVLRGTPESIGKVPFTSIDGTLSVNIVQGQNGNFYIYKSDYNTFYNFLKDLIGYNYSYGQTYYFAAQAIAAEGTAYENSDISEIGANGFARDASKGNERYTVSASGGLIDGSLATVTAGYGVELTLSTEAQEGMFFKGWFLTDAEGNEIGDALTVNMTHTVTVTGNASYKAVFASEKIKLDTIDNTNNEMIKFVKTSTFYIELDRHKNADGSANTAYDAGVDYVRYYMYRDVDGEKQLVSWFDVTSDGYLIDYNGNKNSQQLLGGTGNFFSKMGDGTWHNAIKASYNQGAAANGLAVVWDNDNVVYFACQARTNNTDSYEHGEIGTMGQAWGSI